MEEEPKQKGTGKRGAASPSAGQTMVSHTKPAATPKKPRKAPTPRLPAARKLERRSC